MKAKLEIIVEDNGSVTINGPIANRILCYGMLEEARDAIQEHWRKLAASPIIPAKEMPRLVEVK